MLIVCAVSHAQTTNIKPYFRYYQHISSQYEPVFYNVYVQMSGYSGEYIMLINPTSYSEKFTLAKGLEYGFTIDYIFCNQLGIELSVGYFSSLNKRFKSREIDINSTQLYMSPPARTLNKLADEPLIINSTIYTYPITWNYHSFVIRPMFSYAVKQGKSSFIGKIGPMIQYVYASTSVFSQDDSYKLATCTFTNQLNLGYSIGLEYNHKMSKQLSLAIECGFEQYRYTPNNATVKYKKNDMEDQYEITYVNRIVNEQTPYDYPSILKKIKKTILFNNVYLGIGIKYNLWIK